MKADYKMTKIGEVPEDWEVVNFNEICERISAKSSSDGGRCIELQHIEQGTGKLLGFDKLEEKSSVKSEFQKGDVLFCKLRPYLKKYWKCSFSGSCTSELIVLRHLENSTSDFIFQTVQRNSFIENSVSKSFGTKMPRTSWRILSEYKLGLPPFSEQKEIAKILSVTDERIELLNQKINTTRELKKGLMQQLLTRGIKHTEFKNTVLGKVPVSWEVVKFGEMISNLGYGPRFSSKDYSDTGNVKTIRGTDIEKNGDILYNQVPTAQLPEELILNHALKNLDLVMITTADCGLTGVFIENDIPFIPSAYAVKISLNEKANAFYFKYLLQTNHAKKEVEKFIRKGTVANLPGSDILKFKFAVPPFCEQKKIAEILTTADEKIEVLQKQKAAYQDLKRGLMQQLLTGKIRVKI